MRKVIGVLIIVFVIGVYILSMRGKIQSVQNESQGGETASVETYTTIAQIEKKIDTAYPEKPAQVAALHNELMKIFYSQLASNETIEDYARTIRKLYTTELQGLNSIESQVGDLKTEKAYTDSIELTLVVSEITEVYISKDQEGNEEEAEVNVRHVTSQGTLYRTYFLINEDGLWKINAWESQEAQAANQTTNTQETDSVESTHSTEGTK